MITDFKKRLFCQLSGTKLKDVDADDRLWIDRIESFFAIRSELPPPGDPTEYAAAFEAVYSTQAARRSYIEKAVEMGTPSYAHRVLAALIASGQVKCVFTTNFDSLVETATTVANQLLPAAERTNLTVAGIDNVERAILSLSEGRPLLAKIHGDYQSLHIKNTNQELQQQDARMREVLTSACGRYGLVVVGYSGRDASVMQAVTDALAQPNPFPGGIYWVARSVSGLLPAVKDFLEAAIRAGVAATIVESHTFDELAADILDGIQLSAILTQHIGELGPAEILREEPLPMQEYGKFPVLLCSAIPLLKLPKFARRITTSVALTSVQAREMLKNAEVWGIVASNGKEVAAFGNDDDLQRAFQPAGGRIDGTIELNPDRDSWAVGLLYDALTRAVCRNQPLFAHLRRGGHTVMARGDSPNEAAEKRARRLAAQSKLKQAYRGPLYGKVPNHDYPFHEGVQLRLEQAAGRWWLTFEPWTYVEFPFSDHAEDGESEGGTLVRTRQGDPVIDWRRELWATRYNAVWTGIIEAWAAILAGRENGVLRASGTPEDKGIEAIFEVSPVTAWSRPSHDHDYFHRRR